MPPDVLKALSRNLYVASTKNNDTKEHVREAMTSARLEQNSPKSEVRNDGSRDSGRVQSWWVFLATTKR